MADLAPTPNRRDWFAILLLLAVLAVVPPIAEAVGQPFAIKVASRVVVFAIAAVGLNLVLGFGGMALSVDGKPVCMNCEIIFVNYWE